MVTISKPVGRGRNGDEDMMGKDSGLLIALVCDRTLQSIIPLQISSSFFTKSAEEPNLAEAVEKALRLCRAELRRGPKVKGPSDAELPAEPLAPLLTADEHPYSAHQTERHDRYQQVVTLRKQGMKIKEIASRVGRGRRTVQSWLAHAQYPETNYHHPHRSRFDVYAEYVKRRWDQGCHNMAQLFQELVAQGYQGSSASCA